MNWGGCGEGRGKQALHLYSGGAEKRESPSYRGFLEAKWGIIQRYFSVCKPTTTELLLFAVLLTGTGL